MQKILLFCFSLLLLVACDNSTSESRSLRLVFAEQEKESEPYQTRIIVTEEYIRFDDGEGAQDFVLFDRKARTIYSTNAEEKTTMIVEPRPVDIEPPFALQLKVEDLGVLHDAPRVAGKQPAHYRYSANGEVCRDVVAIEGVMQEYVNAMREFNQVLAGDSAVTFNTIPADLHNACDIARNTFAPNRYLQHGLPIQEWDEHGYKRLLLDFEQDYQADPTLFVLPVDYRSYSIKDLREGRVGRE